MTRQPRCDPLDPSAVTCGEEKLTLEDTATVTAGTTDATNQPTVPSSAVTTTTTTTTTNTMMTTMALDHTMRDTFCPNPCNSQDILKVAKWATTMQEN